MIDMTNIPEFVNKNVSLLWKIRLDRHLTADKLSELTGVDASSIYCFEARCLHPLPEKYNKLAKFLGWQLWEA